MGLRGGAAEGGGAVDAGGGAGGWVVDDTGFAKDGAASPCVARQYSGTVGKVGNCQIAVSVHAVTDACSAALDWRLFVPECWDDTLAADADAALIAARRERCAIPEQVRHIPKWRLALEMLDELAERGHVPPLVVGDAGYGDNTSSRLGLSERGLAYVMAVKATTSAYPVRRYHRRRPMAGGAARPATLRRRRLQPARPGIGRRPQEPAASDLAPGQQEDPRQPHRQDAFAFHGDPGTPRQPRHPPRRRRQPARVLAAGRMATRRRQPTDYWLSTLPTDTPIKTLVRLAKIRWRIEHDYRELKTGLGLTHFEGRSWTGWHRHVTLASAAHLFLTELRLTSPKAAGAA